MGLYRELLTELFDCRNQMRSGINGGHTLGGKGAVRLFAIDRDSREAVAFSCARDAKRCRLTDNEPLRFQAVSCDQPLRTDTSYLLVRGQHDAQTIDPSGTRGLSSGQEAGEESLYVAGATTVEHLFVNRGLDSLQPVVCIGNCICVTRKARFTTRSAMFCPGGAAIKFTFSIPASSR